MLKITLFRFKLLLNGNSMHNKFKYRYTSIFHYYTLKLTRHMICLCAFIDIPVPVYLLCLVRDSKKSNVWRSFLYS